MIAGILRVIMGVRRLWNNSFSMPNDNNSQPRIVYLAKVSFKISVMKTFSGKQKWRKFTTNSCIQHNNKPIQKIAEKV